MVAHYSRTLTYRQQPVVDKNKALGKRGIWDSQQESVTERETALLLSLLLQFRAKCGALCSAWFMGKKVYRLADLRGLVERVDARRIRPVPLTVPQNEGPAMTDPLSISNSTI